MRYRTMEFYLRVAIFIFLFFGRCAGFKATVGHFRLLHRHPKSVTCAAAVLRQRHIKGSKFAISRTIPGTFQNGAKIELTLTTTVNTPVYMDIESDANDTIIPLMIKNVNASIINRKIEVSFVSEGTIIKVLLNGDETRKHEPPKPARLVRRLLIRTDTPMLESRTTLSRFMFTEEFSQACNGSI